MKVKNFLAILTILFSIVGIVFNGAIGIGFYGKVQSDLLYICAATDIIFLLMVMFGIWVLYQKGD
jgi:hypothetical protein